MPRKKAGRLLIVGGHEDKEGDRLILKCLAEEVGGGKLVVATVASAKPEELWSEYEPLFRRLGVKHVHKLDIANREDAKSDRSLRVLQDATGVFFTGGDQLKITSQIGDTPVFERLHEIYETGGIIAGTSAGASVMCETMLVAGNGQESFRIGGALRMAPGLGLLRGVIVDQHFSERGRLPRLLGAVAQNPRMLGVGIDEDTAILVENQTRFTVIGEGAVYVVDGADVGYSNLTDEESDRTLSIFDVRVHMLSMGDRFDLKERRPSNAPAETVEKELVGAGEGDE